MRTTATPVHASPSLSITPRRRLGALALTFAMLAAGCGSGGDAGGVGGEPENEHDTIREASVKAADPFFGISANDTTLDGDPFYKNFEDGSQASDLHGLGVGLVRINFCNWPASKDALEKKVNTALGAGLAVLAELDYCTVPGKSQDPSFNARQEYWHEDFASIDSGNAFVQAFSQAAGEIAAQFAGRISYYGIWNEPDAVARRPNGVWDWDGACKPQEGGYYYGTDDGGKPFGEQEAWALCPRQLGTLTTNAFMAIKAKDQVGKVVAGNIILQGENPGDLSDAYYDTLRSSPAVAWHQKAKGGLPWDMIGIHPYYYTPVDGSKDSLRAELQHWKGRVDSPLAITEVGWTNTWCPNRAPYAGPFDEASYVKQTFQIAREEQMQFVLWFNYLSVPTGGDCGLDMGVRSGAVGHPWKPEAQAYCDAAGVKSCIVSGGGKPRFCPTDFVPRSKMAVYLEKWNHFGDPGWAPPPAQHLFADVTPGDPDEAWMEQLLHDNVTKGYGGDLAVYGPSAQVPREQMAAFLMRMKFHGGDFDAPASDPFKDVSAGNQFAGDIAKLRELEITVGCDDQGNFCPNDLVPRQQMAAFLMRAIHGYGTPPKAGSGAGRFGDVGGDNQFQDYIAQAVDDGVMEACE